MRRTKEDSEKTREEILDAAVTIFSEKGVAATTLSEIAKEAGVTRGAIYWHFDNKADIFDALHERMHQPIIELLLQDLDDDNPNPILRLQEICIYLLERIHNTPQMKEALTLFCVKYDYTEEWSSFQEKHSEKEKKCEELFSRYFRRAQERGILPADADPKILTLSVGCYMMGIITEHIKDPDAFDLKREGALMIQLFFRGLLN